MSDQNYDFLSISEDFYSVQGEGATTGVPSYFIRLKDCNLACGASAGDLKRVKESGRFNTDSGSFKGELHDNSQASWTCDSIPVWLFGEKKPFSYLFDKWKKETRNDGETLFEAIRTGKVNIIWTGGEPTMTRHQECISNFLERFLIDYGSDEFDVQNEIETNGTNYINDNLFDWITQINCSAKLANSGMSKERRIKPDAIRRIKDHWNHWFKFVISTEDDIHEIFRDYIEPFDLNLRRVICMPGLDSQEEFFERTNFVMESAKKYGFIGLTRNHIAAWGKVTGV